MVDDNIMGFPGGSNGKESACNTGDRGSIPGSGRAAGGGIGNPLQYSCLQNSMDREAWRATVHGVTKSGHDWATNTLAFQLLCPSLILFQPHWVLWSSSKKGNAKESSNYCTIALISHASKVILKILQARLQQYVHCELPDVQVGFRKGRGTRDQIANIC